LILSIHGNNKSSTQQEMANYVRRLSGTRVSRYTISRILKKFEITRKKLTHHYAEQSRSVERTKEYKSMIPPLYQPSILALDECSFHLNEVPRYGYSHKSSRANYKKPSQPGNNHTLILCIQNMENKGVIH